MSDVRPESGHGSGGGSGGGVILAIIVLALTLAIGFFFLAGDRHDDARSNTVMEATQKIDKAAVKLGDAVRAEGTRQQDRP